MQSALAAVSAHHSLLWAREGCGKQSAGTRMSWGRKVGCSEKESLVCRSSRLRFLGSGLVGIGALRGHLEKKWKESCVAKESGGGVGVLASLMVDPGVWIVRTAIFYVLLQTGIAPRPQLQISDLRNAKSFKGPMEWIQNLFGADEEQKRNKELAKVRSKWQASIKGTLVRKYRVPSKTGGRKLLSAISSLLADDDTFRDVATHKGCQIRRENAHAESVCCHNVRALFDELPTPHLVVEITVFPAGPITAAHYEKADKIEKVLRTGISI